MKMILLTNGHEAIVDDEDYEKVSRYRWTSYSANGEGVRWYPVITIHSGIFQIQANRSMARVVLGFPRAQCIDHINGNPLDNRKANLRIATAQQNSRNMCKARLGSAASKYKGVTSYYGKWRTYIAVDRKKKYLGYFPCQFCAALAYDMAAIDLFEEYARPNILKAPT
jgi:AP2 domain.